MNDKFYIYTFQGIVSTTIDYFVPSVTFPTSKSLSIVQLKIIQLLEKYELTPITVLPKIFCIQKMCYEELGILMRLFHHLLLDTP